MRAKSDFAPPGAFVIEPMPGRPGKLRLRFFEHAEKITERTHWEYDEYDLVISERDGIEEDVMVSYDNYLKQAKSADEGYVAAEQIAANS